MKERGDIFWVMKGRLGVRGLAHLIGTLENATLGWASVHIVRWLLTCSPCLFLVNVSLPEAETRVNLAL